MIFGSILLLVLYAFSKIQQTQDYLVDNKRNQIAHQKEQQRLREEKRLQALITPGVTGKILKDEYSGTLLAGASSPYYEFNQEDYDKALQSGKLIFLDFYANWCPICRAESPEIQAGFDSLATDKVIGFRVNYNDTETDEPEKQLAKKFGVTYQHTKVILKNGTEVLKKLEQWDRNELIKQINNNL